PALLALAFGVGATRLRSRRLLIAAGATCVIAILFGVEFAVFTGVVLLLIAVRMRMVKPFAIAVLASGIAILALFALLGFAGDFVTGTWQIVRDGRVFVSDHARIPECLRTFAALAAHISEPQCLAYLLWFVALLASSAALASSPLRGRRSDAVWMIGAWTTLAGFSFVERNNAYFLFALPAFLVAALFSLHRRHRPAAIAMTIVLVFLARPLAHVFDVATPLRRAGGVQGGVEYMGVPRARGAIVAPRTAAALGTVQRFVTTQLKPHETFFDFANAATLHYLFARDFPVRWYPVPFYETEKAQRQVIAVLERNRSIRAALIVFPDALSRIDDVPNATRAPLVWRYLETHFTPAVDENGVIFWLRRP
ncbi:MAG TPA: hypothetical protein VN181_04475, partial [Thermoanaerobaculia bacterium]|nr:hypothetical protein [Thermoanaerobaculia bacterium]